MKVGAYYHIRVAWCHYFMCYVNETFREFMKDLANDNTFLGQTWIWIQICITGLNSRRKLS